jgi:hypothetical protein
VAKTSRYYCILNSSKRSCRRSTDLLLFVIIYNTFISIQLAEYIMWNNVITKNYLHTVKQSYYCTHITLVTWLLEVFVSPHSNIISMFWNPSWNRKEATIHCLTLQQRTVCIIYLFSFFIIINIIFFLP